MTDYATLQARINTGEYEWKHDPRDTRDVRNKLRNDAETKFRNDLAAAYGLTGKVEDKVWHYAETEGHATGWGDVLNIYDDLANIAKVAVEQGQL
jgi:hypothetical protein